MAGALFSQRPLVTALEALYDLEGDLQTWARAVVAELERTLRLPEGLGLTAIAHAADFSQYVDVVTASNASAELDAHNHAVLARLVERPEGREAFRMAFYPGDPVATWRAVAERFSGEQAAMSQTLRGHLPGIDGLGLFAYPEPGLVVTAWGLSHRPVEPTARERRALVRLVGHLDAAFRLRTRPELTIAAVAAPGGALVDIADDQAKRLRARLGERVAAIERLRLGDRRRELDAVEDWAALVAGRYTVVPREDPDGKRFYLLVANAPVAEPHARLSQREIDVLRMAARGLTNKAIAFALGLSPAAASTALASAAHKVGLATRDDLVAVARAIFGASGAAADEGAQLTPAEREVFALVRRGMSNAEIARLRGRSVHTTANQVSAILAKLRVPSRRALRG